MFGHFVNLLGFQSIKSGESVIKATHDPPLTVSAFVLSLSLSGSPGAGPGLPVRQINR